ncbi:LysR family transcriptional regulator [Mycobacterium rhizamassiliense]|uniref:Probable hydrogen peroxide-inducible genes activator n=1 Tax=Mycobacterium rhizamassiliense TaxID=1841860 RepID=A0A2U3NXF9_9MYCO|nr:LysR family transcriptional regulator [Mycobacterium rhizamassiliense]SPM36199.1 LysR family transcriptional regulator [Mycobacterium rhizamassiliense]
MTDSVSRVVDLDLRLVGYFAAVAEHRHFGRAAAALRVAQPSLSRQIRRLEQQIGVRLFDRTPQSTRLTEAGEVFLPRAKALLRLAAQATAQARDAAQPGRITIGYTTGMIITPVVRALRREHPDADVHTQHLEWNQPRDALLDHRVDAVVCALPFSTDQLRVTILYDEPRVVLLPIDHRLAGRQSVTLDDIADEPIPKFRDCDPAWNDFWRIDPRPDGSRAPEGPLFETLDDGLELVAAGRAVAITTGFHKRLRPDITTVPLEGVEPGHMVLASRAGDRSRLVAAFSKLAAAHLTARRGIGVSGDGAEPGQLAAPGR